MNAVNAGAGSAERLLMQAIAADPRNLRGYCELARAYESAAEPRKAEITLLRAIEVDPLAPQPHPQRKIFNSFSRTVYRVGELIQVKIKNAGQVSYFYPRRFAACDLSYFDASGRKFLIPPGTHCDLREYLEIKPGETATLFEWDLSECIEDQFGCVKSQPLPPGTYTIRGAFSSFPDGDSTTIAEAPSKSSTNKVYPLPGLNKKEKYNDEEGTIIWGCPCY